MSEDDIHTMNKKHIKKKEVGRFKLLINFISVINFLYILDQLK